MTNCKDLIPVRGVVGIMLFTACFIAYTLRVNMSINIIAMVEPSTDSKGNAAVPECTLQKGTGDGNESFDRLTSSPDYGERHDWDTKIQALILGAYFWGAIITCIPGGVLAERFGPTRTVLISTVLAGGLTLLGPLMAYWHYAALIASRFLIGLCGGVIYPCLHCLVSRWAPPEERGKFIGALMGGNFGTVLTWPILSAIIESLGWTWSFFINGIIVLLWCIVWTLLVADHPEKHKRISEKEKMYITSSLNVSKKIAGFPPYWDIFRSIPLWALLILHYGNLWGLFFLMTAGPNFISTVLGFNLGHTGFLSALPYLARLIMGFIFGFIGDFIRKRGLLPVVFVRKGFVFFSHILPGVLLLVITTLNCDLSWTVTLLTLSLGFNGASTITNLQNSQDLAPNFAGTLYGVINCVGSTTGFITPLIVGYLTQDHNGLREWHIIFSIGAAVYIFTGLVFLLFGSVEIQPWNDKAAPPPPPPTITVTTENEKSGLDNPAFVPEIKETENPENTKI